MNYADAIDTIPNEMFDFLFDYSEPRSPVVLPQENYAIALIPAKEVSFHRPTVTFIGDARTAVEFQQRASEWKKDKLGVSSLSDMFMHPAYQRIMALGKVALPFILRDLQQSGDHWFHALRYIVGEDVAEGTNTVADARAAWLEWGYKNGHI